MIAIRGDQEIARIGNSGRIVADVFRLLKPAILAGTSTAELDRMACDLITGQGGRPAFMGYRGYPANVCISINHEVVHGIPRPDRLLREGDLVGIDVGVEKDGYIADAARSYYVGQAPPPLVLRLLAVTRQALDRAIQLARPGGCINDLSRAIQETAEAAGFSVVRQLCGHGVGTKLHEEPEIPNFAKTGPTPRLRPGMALAIEPMINAGCSDVVFLKDGWTVVTADGQPSAHFEDTVIVTQDQPLVVTQDSGPSKQA